MLIFSDTYDLCRNLRIMIGRHSVQGYTFIEENFPGLFTADTGLPQALDDIKSKKNQFQRSKKFT